MKKYVFLFAGLMTCTILHGQVLPSLQVVPDAEAFGRAGISAASEATAFAWENNASALAFSDKRILSGITYGLWTPSVSGSKILSASFGWKKDRLSLGLLGKTFRSPAYELYDDNGVANQIVERFSPSETILGIGGAYRIIPGLSVGLVARMVSSSLAVDAKATALSADISATFRKDEFQAGLVLAHIGTPVKYSESGNSYPQPTMIKAGMSYEAVKGLHLLTQVDWLFSGTLMAGVAADYWWKDSIGVRAGYHLGSGSQGTASFATVGMGGRIKGFQVDAGWAFLGENHQNTVFITISYAI